MPAYPMRAELDYAPRSCFAHAALPHDGVARVWVKGNAELAWAEVDAGGTASRVVELSMPFYCAVVPVGRAGPREVRVGFRRALDQPNEEVVAVRVPAPAAFESAERPDGTPFSIIAFGCFQPFDVVEGDVDAEGQRRLQAGIDPGPTCGRDPGHVAIRQLFRDVALGVPRSREGSAQAEVLAANPSLIVGNGDQVYVDAGYHVFEDFPIEAHPISAWTADVHPRPRLTRDRFVDFLDATYRAFWSFAPLDAAFRACPSVMTWDDHEIRDGHGSHGDEREIAGYVRGAQSAFVSHQLLRGPLPEEKLCLGGGFDQTCRVHGVPVYLLDTRSNRSASGHRVVSEAQLARFADWLEATASALTRERAPRREIVLVVGVPMFFRFAPSAESHAEEHFADDIADGWQSVENRAQHREVVALLVHARETLALQPIVVSGDIHQTVAVKVWFRDRAGSKRILAHEIVTTGLASAGGYGPFNEALVPEVLPAGFYGTDDFDVDYRGHAYAVDPEVAHLGSFPNFAAVTFAESGTTARWFEARPAGLTEVRLELQWNQRWEDLPRPDAGLLTRMFARPGEMIESVEGRRYVVPALDERRVSPR